MQSLRTARASAADSARTESGARSASRLQHLLDEAARLFGVKGYAATSMRDIAQAVAMLPGSLYYHFSSKEDLLVAVYREGVRQIAAEVEAAVARESDPWRRLEAASVAHMQALLGGGHYSQVVIRVLPADVPGARARLVRLREDYDAKFRALIAALPLPRGADRRALRLMLLGALNWSLAWYREGGDSPRALARKFMLLIRTRLA